MPRRSSAPSRPAPSGQVDRSRSDTLGVPLTLVTGPANAAKAGEVLGGLRARLEQEPILVVPDFWDVEHNQRELADRGAVFGARGLRFPWLFATLPHRAGFGEPPAAPPPQQPFLR